MITGLMGNVVCFKFHHQSSKRIRALSLACAVCKGVKLLYNCVCVMQQKHKKSLCNRKLLTSDRSMLMEKLLIGDRRTITRVQNRRSSEETLISGC